jgi:hypothetical protein
VGGSVLTGAGAATLDETLEAGSAGYGSIRYAAGRSVLKPSVLVALSTGLGCAILNGSNPIADEASCDLVSPDEFSLVFESADFLGGYRERVFLRGSRALYVRQENLNSEGELTAKETVPKWRSRCLPRAALESFLASASEIGVDSWEPKYPKDPSPYTICEGLGFYLSIEGMGFSSTTEAACEEPERFDDFRRLLVDLFS